MDQHLPLKALCWWWTRLVIEARRSAGRCAITVADGDVGGEGGGRVALDVLTPKEDEAVLQEAGVQRCADVYLGFSYRGGALA